MLMLLQIYISHNDYIYRTDDGAGRHLVESVGEARVPHRRHSSLHHLQHPDRTAAVSSAFSSIPASSLLSSTALLTSSKKAAALSSMTPIL